MRNIKVAKVRPDVLDLTKGTPGSSGYDIRSMIDLTIKPGQIYLIPTGFSLEMPNNMEGQIRSRSGLAKKGIVVANGIGTIDSDYRGEIYIMIISLLDKDYTIEYHEKIAQIVFMELPEVQFENTPQLLIKPTDRGEGGFGSTGRW